MDALFRSANDTNVKSRCHQLEQRYNGRGEASFSDDEEDCYIEQEEEVERREEETRDAINHQEEDDDVLEDVEDFENVVDSARLAGTTASTVQNKATDMTTTLFVHHSTEEKNETTLQRQPPTTYNSDLEGKTNASSIFEETYREEDDSASSVGSDGAVVPCYDSKPKRTRTLERMILGSDAINLKSSGYDDDDDDDDEQEDDFFPVEDDGSTLRPPTVMFESVWNEETTIESAYAKLMQNFAAAATSTNNIPLESDTASSSQCTPAHAEDSVSTASTNQQKNRSLKVLPSSAAKLFGGIHSAYEKNKRRSPNRDEMSSTTTGSSRTKDNVVAAVSGLQRSVSMKMAVIGDAVAKSVLSRKTTVSTEAGTTVASTTHDIEAQTDEGEPAQDEEEVESISDDAVAQYDESSLKEDESNPRSWLW
eukprot:CAMPEP_0178772364 /NCGR_PEP_ID=MMETSP0744-20121128/22508_1 /TAXON_ID=913974 /ORGANISM="Nitzschia punctata, Strain CCMP561" /LENGTH=422 /DNA_ID=CAMNT_0020429047 /DNA_START=106 /DNA_END=1370 /DNA_ORIENTATION=+